MALLVIKLEKHLDCKSRNLEQKNAFYWQSDYNKQMWSKIEWVGILLPVKHKFSMGASHLCDEYKYLLSVKQ